MKNKPLELSFQLIWLAPYGRVINAFDAMKSAQVIGWRELASNANVEMETDK